MFEENEISTKVNSSRVSQIEDGLSYLSKSKQELFKSISYLEKKLNPVLMPTPPAEEAENEVNDSLVPLAREIKNINKDFWNANKLIQSLIERLEI